ncbi:uncharacterized protein LOC100854011 [Vitis vinifera]|nr:uncharacterized protein LOC100854011 [Vitis vinifera]|eukprot:XP_010645123.1 PREDICTED: uncharacterized protein LOC100854011 [Vitis vinifera]
MKKRRRSDFSQKHSNSFPKCYVSVDLSVLGSLLTSEKYNGMSGVGKSAGGRVISKKRCNLASDVIEAGICVKDWEIADKRMYDSIRETEMLANMESLKLSRSSWMHDSSPSPPENND